MQNFLRAFCAQAQRRAVRGDDLHAAVAEFRVRVPHAARELDELTNVPDEQRAVKTEFLAEFQAVADEVRRQHRRLRVKPDKIADVVCAVVAGRKEDVVRTVLAPLPQFHADGVKQCLLAHRLDDAGRAQNGDAALNAEARVKSLFRERLALRRGDRHVNAAVVSDEHADLAHVLFDHFSRHGVDTRTIQPHDLSDKIGSVFQNPRSQFFSLDTDSEIVFGMENKGMPYQVMLDRYQQTIRELHIEKLKDRNLFDLSGGQKQTIAFASVYALNPDIFVLDEPSSNLDPEAIQELRRLLLLIKSQGKTIVVSEHRLYFLNGIADRIVLMEHGKLKQSWSARDFALLSTEQIKALGLRSYTPARLELPETMPSRNDTPAVEVKDLAIGYEKGKPVAQHLNFRVYPGEIVGVVGKNGCGKSTLARTLCGLQKELRGEVLYKNSMVPSKRRIRKAYLVMQDPDYQLFTDSVYQELLLALSDQKDKDEKRIDDILDELNLTTYKERHPMSLSGGQKQRTAIGVAALRDAEVLIFDEPTSGLDYKNMESVAGILSALSKRGKAILVISHDNELLMKICSRVIRMDERTSS